MTRFLVLALVFAAGFSIAVGALLTDAKHKIITRDYECYYSSRRLPGEVVEDSMARFVSAGEYAFLDMCTDDTCTKRLKYRVRVWGIIVDDANFPTLPGWRGCVVGEPASEYNMERP